MPVSNISRKKVSTCTKLECGVACSWQRAVGTKRSCREKNYYIE